VGFDESDEGCVEARRKVSHLLKHDPARLEYRGSGGVVQTESGAINVHDSRPCRDLPSFKQDPVGLDPPHAAEPDDVFDLPPRAQSRTLSMVPRYIVAGHEGQQQAAGLESLEESPMLDAKAPASHRWRAPQYADHLIKRLKRRDCRTTVARPDPANSICLHAVVQQPHARPARLPDPSTA
jgi:hypothetical protein